MTVLVAIPYFRCEPYIDEAVGHVLAQTYTDLVCLVAGDGEVPVTKHRDDRLVLCAWHVNRGAPFTQQAMLLGSPFAWYAPHGADDWADPEYLERLMLRGAPAVGSRSLWFHYDDGTTVRRDNDPAYVEFGVFSRDLLRSVGGYGVDRVCGQDTLLFEQLVPHLVPMAWSDEPGYHKRMRDGSLTHNPDTGFGSAYRQEVVWHNAEVAAMCARIGFDDVATIRTYRETLVPIGLRDELQDRADDVARALA